MIFGISYLCGEISILHVEVLDRTPDRPIRHDHCHSPELCLGALVDVVIRALQGIPTAKVAKATANINKRLSSLRFARRAS